MYYYDDYYEQEPSEVDEIVSEAVKNITEIIKGRAKAEIESILSEAEKYKKLYSEAQKKMTEDFHDLLSAREEINALKKEAETKRTSLKLIPFEVGEEVYYTKIFRDNTLTCSQCKGTGRISVKLDDGEYSRPCPKCSGREWGDNPRKKAEYYKYKPVKTKIRSIKVTINESETQYLFEVGDSYSMGSMQEEVYKNYDDAVAAAEKKTTESLEKAKKILEGELKNA